MNTSSTFPMIAMLHAAFGRVYDPEFGISVVDLGLIHEVTVDPVGSVVVVMTLTSHYCPAGEVILAGIKAAAESVSGVSGVELRLVWEPMWTPDRLSLKARVQLGWDDPQVNA